jgi:shikimate dehydrogenase
MPLDVPIDPTAKGAAAASAPPAACPAVAADVPAYVRGTTRLYPVVGYPVGQVKAPMLYNALFGAAGLDAACVPLEIRPDDFPTVFPAVLRIDNVAGAMVTIPHKSSTVALLDDCSDAVRIAGACNAVVRRPDGTLYGDLFDGTGFVRALRKHGFEVAGTRCLVVGAGGAGAAIAAALSTAGAVAVRLSDNRPGAAKALAAHLSLHFPAVVIEAGLPAPSGFGLVVNATPLGMDPDDPLPVDVSQFTPAQFVAEIVMKREITPMLEAARACGCATMVGREMLDEQVPLYLEFFGLSAATDGRGSAPADCGSRARSQQAE